MAYNLKLTKMMLKINIVKIINEPYRIFKYTLPDD
jgi:hypothetical protein